MARIRSVKPEFWTSEPVMDCSRDARLFLLGLWNFVDDAGRHLYAPRQLKASIFPGDDIELAAVEAMIEELAVSRLVEIYVVDGKRYLQVADWELNQKIDHPTPSKLPANPSSKPMDPVSHGDEASPSPREGSRELRERSAKPRRGLAPESSRVEGSRVEGNESESSSSVAACAKDDDGLLEDLRRASGGNLAPGCADTRPLRRMIARGAVTREDVVAYFTERIPKLSKPLQTLSASFLEPELLDFAEARRKARSGAQDRAELPPPQVFVAKNDRRWGRLSGRYRARSGIGPPDAKNPAGHGESGWYFDPNWVAELADEAAA